MGDSIMAPTRVLIGHACPLGLPEIVTEAHMSLDASASDLYPG